MAGNDAPTALLDRDHFAATLYASIVSVFRSAHADHIRFLARHDLTPRQYCVLSFLDSRDAPTFTEMSRSTWLLGSSLTGIVDRLESKGLASRSADEVDRRQIRVTITLRGRELLRRVPTVGSGEVLCHALDRLPSLDRRQLLDLVASLSDLIDSRPWS